MVLQGWAQAPGVAQLVLLTQKLRGEVLWGQGLDLCEKEVWGGVTPLLILVSLRKLNDIFFLKSEKKLKGEPAAATKCRTIAGATRPFCSLILQSPSSTLYWWSLLQN